MSSRQEPASDPRSGTANRSASQGWPDPPQHPSPSCATQPVMAFAMRRPGSRCLPSLVKRGALAIYLDDLIDKPPVFRSDEGNNEPVGPGAGSIRQCQVGPNPAVVQHTDVRDCRDGKSLVFLQGNDLALLAAANGIDEPSQINA